MAARPGRRQPRDRLAEGFDGQARAQRAYLDEFWSRADVEIDGGPALQQAVRFTLFQTLQASARARSGPPAKGLTARVRRPRFWDREWFVLPLLTYIAPDLARDALIWRHSALGPARQRPARWASPAPCSPAHHPRRGVLGVLAGRRGCGPRERHIADAVRRYVQATGDQEFERRYGVELLAAAAACGRGSGVPAPMEL